MYIYILLTFYADIACGLPHSENEGTIQFFEKSKLLAERHKVTIQKIQVYTEILLYNRIQSPTTASQ